jgi:DNA-binding MarR family transcriptional regulator
MPDDVLENRNRQLEQLRQVFVSNVRDDGPDLSMRQLAIFLLAHYLEEEIGIRELTVILRIPKPAVVRGVSRLERLKLVNRRQSVEDRRTITIHLTARGRMQVRQIEERARVQSPL